VKKAAIFSTKELPGFPGAWQLPRNATNPRIFHMIALKRCRALNWPQGRAAGSKLDAL